MTQENGSGQGRLVAGIAIGLIAALAAGAEEGPDGHGLHSGL